MFSLWRMIINIVKIPAIVVNIQSCVIKLDGVIINKANILEKLTILEKYKMIKNNETEKMKNGELYANKTPALVATALPPLN